MTATIETATESKRIQSAANRAQSPESGFEAALLGSVEKAIGSIYAGDLAGVGHGSASAAPGKRRDDEKETVRKARVLSDPSAVASGELATHGAPKATVQAAEAQQVTADPKATASRTRSANATSQSASSNKSGSEASSSGAQGTRAGSTSRAPATGDAAKSSAGDTGLRHAATRGDVRASSKASIPVGQSKSLDAGQALARLAQAINRAADRSVSMPTANRSVLRVETARPAQKNASIKPASPTSRAHQAQQAQDDFAAQLHRGFSAVLRQNGGSLTLRMQPEALGDLTIRMDLQPGQVAAQFEVSSDQARQLLNDHMTSLRSALEARGLSVDKLTVNVSDRPAPEAQANRAEPGTSGGAGTHDGGASSGHGDRSGVEHPLASLARSAPFDDVVSVPGEGSDVHTGGAQTVRLVLDAVA